MQRKDTTITKTVAVLIPVVVGSFVGLTTSLLTSYYTFQVERKETIRKEQAAHIERGMTLAAKYTNDLSKCINLGLMTKGDVTLTAQDIAVLTAPTDTLMELEALVSLYLPQLKGDVDSILLAHATMMKNFDEIIDARNKHREENAAAFIERFQKEVAPAGEAVHRLMKKLGDVAQRNDA